ncbi:hypothetical protein [Spirosoma radiotolerans]|nr:hypothetical protein [Spirosoma radiotolerans]
MKNKIYVISILFLCLLGLEAGYAQQTGQAAVAPILVSKNTSVIGATSTVNEKKAASPPASPTKLRKRNELSLLIGAGGGATYTYGGIWLQKTAPVLFIEPQYSLSPRLNLGLRLEGIMPSTYRATYKTSERQYNLVKASAMYSVALMLDYNFAPSTATYTPFVGVGIGNYFRGKGDLISDPIPQTVDLGVSSGVTVRAGVSSTYLMVSAEINMLNENQTNGDHVTWWGRSGEFRGRSYVSLKASLPLVLLLP